MEVQLSDLHEHPLVLSYVNNKYMGTCHICEFRDFSTAFYYCAQCSFFLHYTCAVTLPQHINHPFHLHHPLILSSNIEEYECHVCKHRFEHFSDLENPKSYTCVECNFHIHIECALLPTIPCGKRIKPLCHLQPMSLIENYNDYDGGVLECYVCESPCRSGSSTTSAFVCTICKRSIHHSCIEFPLQMTHPFIPSSSPLLQVERHQSSCRGSCRGAHYNLFCSSCHRNTHTFSILYENQCHDRLLLCLPCVFLRPTIEYPGHNHLLCFMEKYDNIPQRCNAYDTYCQRPYVSSNDDLTCINDAYDKYCQRPYVSSNDELNCTNKTFIFRCAPCNFTLHLLCGPLPCTIKHKCHIHTLTLLDSMVEDNSGEYYCDACETERDPRLCVYYCAECKFIAHVVRVLKGDLKDVELRVVGQRKFDRELVRLGELELQATRNIIKDAIRERELQLKTMGSQAYNYAVRNSINEFTYDEDFNKLIHRHQFQWSVDGGFNQLPWYKDLQNIEFVKAGGYIVAWNYAHILKDLLDKHGDISVESKLSIDEKSITYVTLCRVLNSMRQTLLVDVTERLLQGWHACLEMVKFKGFQIDFVYARFDQVVHAYYGLQASRAEKEMEAQMDQEIAYLQHQVLQLRQQIQNVEAKLESCKEHRQDYRKQKSSKKCSDLMKECLSKASMLKWEAAGKDLI